jgi:hypothetical protein
MLRSSKWKWSYHLRDQQLRVDVWQLRGLLTPSQLSFRIPSWIQKSALVHERMLLLYTRKLWKHYTLKLFYVFSNIFSNFKFSEI